MELHSSTGGRPIEPFSRNLILALRTWVNCQEVHQASDLILAKGGQAQPKLEGAQGLCLFGSGGLSAASLALKSAENAPAAAAAFQDTIKYLETCVKHRQIVSRGGCSVA